MKMAPKCIQINKLENKNFALCAKAHFFTLLPLLMMLLLLFLCILFLSSRWKKQASNNSGKYDFGVCSVLCFYFECFSISCQCIYAEKNVFKTTEFLCRHFKKFISRKKRKSISWRSYTFPHTARQSGSIGIGLKNRFTLNSFSTRFSIIVEINTN